MNSPSDLSILRVYLPSDLVDQLHAMAASTGMPMRKVVRGVLELGIPEYVSRWRDQAVPTYEDGLSERPHQLRTHHVDRTIRAQLRMLPGAAPRQNGQVLPYDDTSAVS